MSYLSRNLFIISAVVSFSFSGIAQPTITSSHMPVSGDTLRYSLAATAGVNIQAGKTGAGQTWDFSALSSNRQDVASYLSALKTNYAFYFINQIGLKTADSLGAGPLLFRNIYSFYTKNSSVFKAEGIGYTYSSIPLAANYTDDDEIYQFPLNYNDSDISTFRFKFTIPGDLFSLVQSGTRINYADGYGTVITPYKTYNNVLRVRTVINEVDTLISSLGKFPIPRKTVAYKYLSTSEKIPVLEITGTDQGGNFVATEIKYRDQYRGNVNPFKPTANYTVNKTSGIAGTDTFVFKDVTANPPSTSRTWTITPSNGVTFTGGTTGTSATSKVVFSKSGTYTVKLSVTSVTGNDDTTTNNQISIGANGLSASQPDLYLYPNPAKDFFIVGQINTKTVMLYDLTGKTVLEQNTVAGQPILTKTLKPGLYWVDVTGANDLHYYSKILIQ